ncbi:hypothetical protein CHS0354_026736 [Potamilus streckersoni]|nr:hypothetical protein CHS0354_026736 [Potamilus streckersoni]
MKPRQRRIESFHEGRGHPQPGNNISQGRYTPLPPQPTVDPQSYPSSVSGQVDTVPVSSAPLTTLRGNLRGWATQQDLSALRSPITVNTTNVPTNTYPGPLSPAKSTPVLNKENISPASPQAYSSMQPQTLIPAKSSPDIPENLATSLHSPPSPSLYNIPRSPYTKQHFEFNVQQQRKHPFQGSSYSPFVGKSGYPSNEPQNVASLLPNGRRSLPPQMPYQQEYLSSFSVSPQLRDLQKPTGSMPSMMPMTKEEDVLDKEIPEMQPAGKEDNRPLYSPPAPPVRDISSLKYIGFNQNHEKYPSWPVPHPNPNRDGNPPLDPQTGYHPQLGPVHEKERTTSEENKPRNASDPGFNKEMKKNFYTRRKPTAKDSNNDYENLKTLEERFEDFCNNSKPGYPPPLLDPDGHNIGDEKYNIPSPPERDVSQLDQKTLAHKIAAVVSSGYQSQGQGQPDYYSQYNVDSSYAANRKRVDTTTSPIQSPGVSSQSGQLPQNSKMVDSSTSPLNSPLTENKVVLGDVKYSRGTFQPSGNKSRGVIIRQTPYYNTGTQTEDSFSKTGKDSMGFSSSDPPKFTEKSVQAQMSYSSVSSDCEGTSRYSDEDSRSKHFHHQEFPLDSYMEHSKSADHHNCTKDSGIMSINSDILGAPLLRKLSEEFRGGKLHSIPSSFDDLRSPRPESLYGSLHGAESYSSVVIHPYENPMPFGRDDYSSNVGSKSDSLSSENTPVKSMSSMDLRNPPATKSTRYSIDGSFARQSLGMSLMPHRSLPDSEYTSESSLNSPYYSRSKEYSQSMLHLNKRSLGSSQAHSFHFPSESSLHPRTSSEAGPSRSLKSSSDSSNGRSLSRLGSDSVFPEKSPGPVESKDPTAIDSSQLISSPGSRGPLKYPYSSFDENERPSSTFNFHQRTESDVSATSNDFPTASHARSVSYTDYMPMYGYTSQSQADANRLAQIQEESSESRWQAAVDKSRSLLDRNYMNTDHGSSKEPIQSEKVTDSSESVPYSESVQKPEFKRQQSDHFKFSNTGFSESSNKASELSSNIEIREPRTDSSEDSNRTSDDLKRMQQKAVLNFMEIKLKEKGQNLGEDVKPDSKSESSLSEQESSSVQPIIDFSKYNYTRDQRNESLRRSRSISSNSSRDSADYVEMKKPERLYAQTEWSRIRLQTVRPSSIGSDASGSMDTYMISPLSPLPPSPLKGEPGKSGDPIKDQISGPGLFATTTSQQLISLSSGSSMVASPGSPTYSNLQDNQRRLPPPPPRQVDEGEEQPPALPPRSYRNMPNSTSDSVLLRPRENLFRSEDKKDDKLESRPLHHKWDNSPREDTYAEQLRKQARRLSEHRLYPMSTSMSIMTTKTPMHTTQSYKQEQAQVLEATSIKSTPGQESAPGVGLHSSAIPSPGDSEPPPLPPPREVSKGESVESSHHTELPLPPPEVLQDSSNENKGVDHRPPEDGCADDSYGSYKSRTYNRHLGTYKRTQSDSNVQQNITDKANHKDMTEVPNKPPRKKLEQSHENLVSQHSNFRDGPLSQVDSSSINHDGSELAIPTFQASEVMPGKTMQMFVAQPLQVSNKTLDSSNPGGFLKMSPKMSTSDSVNISGNKSEQTERKTVQDRIRNLEHSHYSPNSAPNRTSIPKTSAVNNVKNMFESLSGSPDERERGMLVKKSSFSRTQNSYQESKGSSEKSLENYRTGGEQIVAPRPEDLQLNKRSLNEQTPPVNRLTPQHSESLLIQGTRQDHSSPSSVQGISNLFPLRQSSGDLSIHRINVENRTEQTILSKSHAPPFSSSRLARSQLDVRADPGPQTRERTESGSCLPGSNHSLEKQAENSIVDSSSRSQLDFKNENRLSTPRPAPLDLNKQKGVSGVPSQDSRDSDAISPPSELPFIRYGKRPHHSSGNKVERQTSSSSGSVTKASSVQSDKLLISSNSSQQPNPPLEWQQQTIPKFNEQISNQKQRTSLKSDKCISEENKINKSSQESVSNSSASDVTQIMSVHRREPSHEELECDKKAEELVEVLKDSEKQLTEVLRPDNKNRMDYMDGLFTTPVDIKMPNKSHSFSHKISAEKDAGKVDSEKMDTKKEEDNSPNSPLPSTYYVSSSKARIEIDMRHHKEASLELIEDIGDNDSLVRKKEELLQSMMKKLDILNEEKQDIMQEISENEGLGKKVTQIVEQKCTNQNEKDKYKSYINDIEKIVRLLLKLSGLLARAENAVQSLPKDANDKIKKMTLEKREKLYSQHEDAKDLKRDVDRRSQQVAGFLEKCLDSSEMDDYNYFVSMKSKLTIQMQELEDKIALGNEQIQALQKSIPHRD